ncbi:MAG TPA: hypothetical protein VMB79_00265 [Jatrophihabitans sp.]|nr:hypothetical protein [Jatrophihabitans sp.]
MPDAPRPDPTRIASLGLWSAPRSMSTAFFRMMAERDEFRLSHEPFSELAAGRPAKIDDESYSGAGPYIHALVTGDRPAFFKDTTEYRHAALFDRHPELYRVQHTFIIRDPRRVIDSHHAMNPAVTRDEIGFEHLVEVFRLVQEHTGTSPVVIDADDLVTDPAGVVAAYCRRLGLAERPETLSWRPENRTEWGATAQWHRDAAASGQFQASERVYPVTTENDERLAGYLAHHLPFYHYLREFSLTGTGNSR